MSKKTEYLTPQESVKLFCLIAGMEMSDEAKIRLAHILIEYWRAGEKDGREKGANDGCDTISE